MINICVPYRNMPISFNKFLSKIKTYKNYSDINFLIVEQSDDNKRFNLGKLINVGFNYYENTKNNENWIFMFNPIDMFPSDGLTTYLKGKKYLEEKKCDFLGYHYNIEHGFYKSFACSKNTFKFLNGFTNKFWGYGAEDDEFFVRIRIKNMKREYKKISFESWGEYGEDNLHSYHSPDALLGLDHHNTNLNTAFTLSEEKMDLDGLSTLSYNIIDKTELHSNIIHIKVNI